MSVIEVDCRGLACPQPVIEAKKALESGQGKTIIIAVDNEAARENVSRFAANAGRAVDVEKKEGCYYLTITRSSGEVPAEGTVAKDVFQCGAAAGIVYFITTSGIGQGPPDLGETLMKSFMVTLTDHQPPPAALLFLNSGVHLAVEGSPVLGQLQKLSGAGTEILVCGSCLNYYKLKEKLAVGVVSNMYEINSHLAGPGKVVTVG